MQTIKLKSSECPLAKVVVYAGGAHMSRKVCFAPKATGLHSIELEGLAEEFLFDSVRVSGVGGCRIEDVMTTQGVKRSTDLAKENVGNKNLEEIEALIKSLKQYERDHTFINQSVDRINYKRKVVDTYIKAQLASTPHEGYVHATGVRDGVTDPKHLEEFVSRFTELSLSLDKEELQQQQELKEIDEKFKLALERLYKLLGSAHICMGLRAPRRPNPTQSLNDAYASAVRVISDLSLLSTRTITILVDVTSTSPIELEVKYYTTNASWYPSYDIRMSDEEDDGAKTLQVQAFGHVRQNTRVDWNEVDLSLSTTNINEDSTPPTLVPKTVRFKEPPPPPMNTVGLFGGHRMRAAPMMMVRSQEMACSAQADFEAPEVLQSVAVVEGSGVTTSFRISRPTTVESDGSYHKVVVGDVTLSGSVIKYCVPSMSTSVFLQAKTKNTSDFPILVCRDNVNIYINNFFLGKTSFNEVTPPGGTLFIAIGLEHTVSARYIAPKSFSKQLGILSKSNNRTYECITFIRNSSTKEQKVVLVQEMVRAADKTIVIKMISPPAAQEIDEESDLFAAAKALEMRGDAMLNKCNNHLLRKVVVPPSSQVEVKFIYSCEWPEGKDVIVKEDR